MLGLGKHASGAGIYHKLAHTWAASEAMAGVAKDYSLHHQFLGSLTGAGELTLTREQVSPVTGCGPVTCHLSPDPGGGLLARRLPGRCSAPL